MANIIEFIGGIQLKMQFEELDIVDYGDIMTEHYQDLIRKTKTILGGELPPGIICIFSEPDTMEELTNSNINALEKIRKKLDNYLEKYNVGSNNNVYTNDTNMNVNLAVNYTIAFRIHLLDTLKKYNNIADKFGGMTLAERLYYELETAIDRGYDFLVWISEFNSAYLDEMDEEILPDNYYENFDELLRGFIIIKEIAKAMLDLKKENAASYDIFFTLNKALEAAERIVNDQIDEK